MRSCKLSPCCEATSDERSAGNLHAAFCGSRVRVTAPATRWESRRRHGEPKRARSWKRRIQPRNALQPVALSSTRSVPLMHRGTRPAGAAPTDATERRAIVSSVIGDSPDGTLHLRKRIAESRIDHARMRVLGIWSGRYGRNRPWTPNNIRILRNDLHLAIVVA
jgi:hypothetical protein